MSSSDNSDSSAAGRSESPNGRRLAKELAALAMSDDHGGRRKPEDKQKYPPKHLIIDDDTSGNEDPEGSPPRKSPRRNRLASSPNDSAIENEDLSESGNRIVDIGALEKAVHDVACCKKCAEKWHREQLMKFFNYCEEIKRRNPVSEQYQTWLSLQDKGDEIGCSCQLSVSSESHGFASDIFSDATEKSTARQNRMKSKQRHLLFVRGPYQILASSTPSTNSTIA